MISGGRQSPLRQDGIDSSVFNRILHEVRVGTAARFLCDRQSPPALIAAIPSAPSLPIPVSKNTAGPPLKVAGDTPEKQVDRKLTIFDKPYFQRARTVIGFFHG